VAEISHNKPSNVTLMMPEKLSLVVHRQVILPRTKFPNWSSCHAAAKCASVNCSSACSNRRHATARGDPRRHVGGKLRIQCAQARGEYPPIGLREEDGHAATECGELISARVRYL